MSSPLEYAWQHLKARVIVVSRLCNSEFVNNLCMENVVPRCRKFDRLSNLSFFLSLVFAYRRTTLCICTFCQSLIKLTWLNQSFSDKTTKWRRQIKNADQITGQLRFTLVLKRFSRSRPNGVQQHFSCCQVQNHTATYKHVFSAAREQFHRGSKSPLCECTTRTKSSITPSH